MPIGMVFVNLVTYVTGFTKTDQNVIRTEIQITVNQEIFQVEIIHVVNIHVNLFL